MSKFFSSFCLAIFVCLGAIFFAGCDGKVDGGAPDKPPKNADPSPGPRGEDGPYSMHSAQRNGRYTSSMAQKMEANYAFSCPDHFQIGRADVAKLVLSPSLSKEAIREMVDEQSIRFSGSTTVTPYVEASLDIASGDALTVKAITPLRQKLLPKDKNNWTWQIMGNKPGTYVLTVTLSLCGNSPNDPPIATPIAFSKNIEVSVEGGQMSTMKLVINIVRIIVIIGLLALLIRFISRKFADRKTVVLPPPSDNSNIFVSYSRFDMDRVDKIVSVLEEQGHTIWIDREGIESASSWRAEIANALSNSRYLVFFASEKSYSSENVNRELAMAADENLKIVPVLLEDCEPTGAAKFVIAGLQRIEGRKRSAKAVAADISKVVGGSKMEETETVEETE